MSRTDENRKSRCEELVEYIEKNPLATDETLSQIFNVSINTIRLDRARLGIKELKERLVLKATKTMDKVTSISKREFMGELIEFVPMKSASSKLETKPYMCFTKTKVVKGEYIYALAESLAISLIPTKEALVGVASIKYFEKIMSEETVIANAEIKKKTATGYIVWIRIVDKADNLKFRGKFILKGIE